MNRFITVFSFAIFAVFQSAYCGCDDGDKDQASVDVRTSACVNGTLRTDIVASGGGGYTPPGTPSNPNPGPHTVNGFSTNNYSQTLNTTTVHVTVGKEYSVNWQKVGFATVTSLHTRLSPRNLPAGYKIQVNKGDGNGWVDQTQIDNYGTITDVTTVTHKFRVIAPVGEAGEMSNIELTETQFATRPNPATNGLALIAVNDDGDSSGLPDYKLPQAKMSIDMGAATSNGAAITAGSLIFKSGLWVPPLQSLNITPANLLYEAPVAGGIVVITDVNGNIRQIKAPQVLADVITISADKFEVRLYSSDNVGSQPSFGQPFAVSGSPFAKSVFEKIGSFNGFDYGVRITRYVGGVQETQVDMAGEFGNNGTQIFKTIRKEGQETVNIENRILWYSPGQQISAGGFNHTVTSQPFYYRDRTEETYRENVLVGKNISRYLLHSVGGWGLGALGGFGDILLESKEFFGAGANDYLLTQQWINLYNAPLLNQNNSASLGKPAFVYYPDGSWVRYIYDVHGNIDKTYRSHMGTPTYPLDATDTNCVLETSTEELDPYVTPPVGAPAAFLDAMKTMQGTAEKKILGNSVSRTQSSYTTTTAQSGAPLVRHSLKRYYSNTGYLETTTDTYHDSATDFLRGRLASVTTPEGVKTSYEYEKGDFNVSTRVFTVSPTGVFVREKSTTGTTVSPAGIANKTTQEIEILDSDGNVHQEAIHIFTGGSTYEQATVTDYYFDDLGRTVKIEKDGRVIQEITYNGLVTQITDESGVEVSTTRDVHGRVISIAKTGGTTTSYVYSGLTTTKTTGTLVSTSVSDMLGNTASETSSDQINLSYTYPSGGRDVQISYPGGLSVKHTNHPGGSVQSITNVSGNKTVPRYFEYGVEASGNKWSRVRSGASNSVRWDKSTTDWLGRVITTETPAPSGSGTVVTTTTYNANGQKTKVSYSANMQLNDTYYEYDSLGRLFREGIDFNGGGLDLNSVDRVMEYDRSYEKSAGGYWYEVNETREYQADNNPAYQTIKTEKIRLHGNADGFSEHITQTDASGNVIDATVAIDRAQKKITRTTKRSDTTEDLVETIVNGLKTSEKGSEVDIVRQYDALERPWKLTNQRTGSTVTLGYNANGQRITTQDHLGQTTTTHYYPATHKNAGKVQRIVNANNKSEYYEYNDMGQRTRMWGDSAYPEFRTYNIYGELETLTTYRGGTGWNGSSWPAGNEGSGDTTTWRYFDATGYAKEKEDANGAKTQYTWRDNGQLHTRTLARNLITTYSYDGSGLETGVSYSDGTPSVAYTRYRTGLKKTVTDASGTANHSYTNRGLPDMIQYTGSGVLSGLNLDFDRSTGRIVNQIKVTQGANTLYTVDRQVDPVTGSLASIVSGTNEAKYYYHKNSDLVRQISWFHAGQLRLTNARNYDVLNRLSNTAHYKVEGGVAPIALQAYDYDVLNRRNKTTLLDASYWDYVYNDRNEVKEADKKLSGATLLAGWQYRFNYDNLGNRTSYETGGDAAGVGRRVFNTPSNSLNQYSGYNSPATFDVLGKSPNNVTVNSAPALKQGDYFRSQVTASNNNPNGEWKQVTVNSGAASESGHVYVAPASFTPVYDSDGNLTDDGEWGYVYDAENRLVSITRTTRAQTAGAPYRKLEFKYDYMHRRIEKKVYHASGGAAVQTERYIYNGWNRLLALNGSLQAVQKYVWGIDISGSLRGAGGVGGLLWIEDIASGKTHFACSDGNGNVVNLFEPTSNSVTATYEYSPFGETIRSSGSAAALNPFRFSSKPQDSETDLLYYGNRSYKPHWGVWLNRDRIGERGGINLYGFVNNDAVNQWDFLGNQVIICTMYHKEYEAYLASAGVKLTRPGDRRKRFHGKDVTIYRGAKFKRQGGLNEILGSMIRSGRRFYIRDIKRMKAHAEARLRVTQIARNAKCGFGAGASEWRNPDYWVRDANASDGWRLKKGLTREEQNEAFRDLYNNPKTRMGCFFGAQQLFELANPSGGAEFREDASGISAPARRRDWIPGDWGAINNKNFNPKVDPHGARRGENIVYLGKGDFWGLYPGKKIRSLQKWIDEVNSWDGGGGAELKDNRFGPSAGRSREKHVKGW